MKRFWIAAVLCVALAGSAMASAPSVMSVQVRNGQLRATANFLGKIVGSVAYADQVSVVGKQGDWMQVKTATGATGWIHQSALSAKKIVLKAGAEDVNTAASGQELALAGKGFNSEVEADFKKKNQNIDFGPIDRMEKIKITAAEAQQFLAEGGVKPVEVAR